MLILTRKIGESVYIGDEVKITFVELKGAQIRLGIDAPKGVRIYREEIYLQILEENRSAAQSSDEDLKGLESRWKPGPGKSVSVGSLTTQKVQKSNLLEDGTKSQVETRSNDGHKVVIRKKRQKSPQEE
jgi:carbon storage regulator